MQKDEPISDRNGDYGVATDPIVRTHPDAAGGTAAEFELPRSYGDPILMAIPRDPTTIFVCWSVDWEAAFGERVPADRQVHLRASAVGGGEDITVQVEPLKATATLEIPKAGVTYIVELGFFNPASTWNCVAASEPVAMPAAGTAPILDFELATIPLHLSFQRMIELFRGSKSGEIVASVAELEGRFASAGAESLSDAEREALRVLEFTEDKAELAPSVRASVVASGKYFAKRVESLLGSGATSPGGQHSGGS